MRYNDRHWIWEYIVGGKLLDQHLPRLELATTVQRQTILLKAAHLTNRLLNEQSS